MSNPSEPSRNIAYGPLPSTSNNDHSADSSASPEPPSLSYHTPQPQFHDLSPDELDAPPLDSVQTPFLATVHPDPETGLRPVSYAPSQFPVYRTPDNLSRELIEQDLGASPTIATPQPRFIGPAAYGDTGGPHSRYSIASEAPSAAAPSEFHGSVYALNDARPYASSFFDDRSSYRDDPHDNLYAGHQRGITRSPVDRNRYLEEKHGTYAAPRTVSKRKLLLLSILAGGIFIILAVAIPIYFTVVKPKKGQTTTAEHTSAAKPSGTTLPTQQQSLAVTGGDGSTITMDDGTAFVYHNSFGGYWYFDENDPFNNGAKAQSWTPALNETFNYGIDKIRGVNLGGWLNTEPFMQVTTPALFEAYPDYTPPVVDEWTLSQAMAADTANGGLGQLENHYKTFITEQDFAQIAGAGLNYVRIPLPYWAIETRGGEPFLAKTSWTYFLKAIEWARKYGLRINLDFHALPGSQNGWNHSGRLGTVNVLSGPMGLANAQRSLDYIRIISEFISQPQYSNVVTMFGVTNEPQGSAVGLENLSRYYLQAYNLVRAASGVGEGNGPFISYHDAFFTRGDWAGFLTGADRIALDSHPYLCFGPQSSSPISSYATTPCSAWGGGVNNSMAAFGLSTAGEFSNAVTDCGKWVNGVGLGARYDGTYTDGTFPTIGDCDTWTDWQNYDQHTKKGLKQFALSSMDALQNWFFWTWKIGNSSVTGKVESPAWSYQLGLEQGWMPTDPREAIGSCNDANPWNPPLSAWQTGGAGAGNIAATDSAAFAWPPTSIAGGGPATLLPTYTPTGPVPTLPGPSFTASATGAAAVLAGNGWQNAADTAGLMVPIESCSYLDPWIGPAAPPSPLCSGSARKKRGGVEEPQITPAPA